MSESIREFVEDLVGPPREEVLAVIAHGVSAKDCAERIEREIERQTDLPHDLRVVGRATTDWGFRRAAAATAALIHILAVAEPLSRELWQQLDRARSQALPPAATLVFVLDAAQYEAAVELAPNTASLMATGRRDLSRRVRVIAHPLHEYEHAAVHAETHDAPLQQIGPEMLVGEMEEDAVEALRAKNIVVETYGPVMERAPGRARSLAALDGAEASWPKEFEAFVDLRARAALTVRPIHGASLLRARDDGRMTLRVDHPDALEELEAFGGVSELRGVAREAPHDAAEDSATAGVWAVQLDQPERLADVRTRAEAAGATVLKADGGALRVRASTAVIRTVRGWPEVLRADEYVEPTLSADLIRAQIGIEATTPAGARVELLAWDGAGELVAVADSGVDATHPAFRARIHAVTSLVGVDGEKDLHGHGTHVAGLIAGDDASHRQLRGAAPGARLFVQGIVDLEGKLTGLPADLGTLLLDAYARGARIHNDSWGAAVEGRYDLQAEQIDAFVATHRDMLVVIAAGNRGSAAKPINTEATAEPGFVEYKSLDAPAVAKNALTVGACQSARASGGRADDTYFTRWPDAFPDDPIRSQAISGAPESMAAFSSRGPVAGQRIKPDLVAPGTSIASAWPSSASSAPTWGPVPHTEKRYYFMGGTSMAAPVVAGCAARVRQYYREARSHLPSAALLKATLLQGARPLTGADATHRADAPNFHQGFGCVDMRRTLPAPSGGDQLAFLDPWQQAAEWLGRTGASARRRFELTASGALRVCLAWTDPAGAGLIHNLRLIVELPDGTKRLGNDVRAGKTRECPTDEANNVIAVRIEAAPAGPYTVVVSAVHLPKGPQDFALVVFGPLRADQLA